ncbi:MAG: sugar transferase [Pseudomonadota bacterium]
MNLQRSFFGVYYPTHKLTLLVTDLLCIALAFFLASKARLNIAPDYLSLEYVGLNIVIISSLFIGGAYTSSTLESRPRLPLNTFFIVLAAAIPGLLFIYLLGPERFTAILGRGVFPFAMAGLAVIAVLARFLVNSAFKLPNRVPNILLLGSHRTQERLSKSLEIGHSKVNLIRSEEIEFIKSRASNLSAIVISPDHTLDEREQQMLIDYRLAGIPIFSLSDFFESFLFLVPVQEINNDWFIRAQGFTMLHSSVAIRVKRAVDIVAALLLLVLNIPICLLTALLIKLTSRGPVMFSQRRIGLNGTEFVLYKFRTMRVDAEVTGAQWTSKNDPRILPIGNFLRSTRIDELPQCWNILKGDMSIVGPRPERPEFTSDLAQKIPYYDLRHIIKPGLTGWAQVMYPYGASIDDALKKLQFDLYYVKNYSLLLDLNILLRTILVTLRRGGR